MLIDFHTHIFPEKIAAKTLEILSGNCMRVSGRDSVPRFDATLDGLKAAMKRESVDISIVLPIATTVRQSGSINRYAAEINGHDGIYSFGSLHPEQEDWEEVMEDIKAKGLKGIKLHPEYQQVYIDSPEAIRVLKKAEELGLYVTLHTGCDVGMDPPVHCEPERLRRVLDIVSGENIIAAHMGGWRSWNAVYEHLAGTGVYLDTAYIASDIKPEEFMQILKKHGSSRILFATDMPWEAPHETKSFIDALPISEADRDRIYYKNACDILGI